MARLSGAPPADLDALSRIIMDQDASNVATMSRLTGVTNIATLATGVVYGTRAVARQGGTFTKMRVKCGTTVSAVTQLRLGVWDENGLLLSDTGDIPGSAVGGTLIDNVALNSAVTLAKGQAVYLGLGWVGTTLHMWGSPTSAPIAGLLPVMTRSIGGWVSGTLPTLSGAGTIGQCLWAELIP